MKKIKVDFLYIALAILLQASAFISMKFASQALTSIELRSIALVALTFMFLFGQALVWQQVLKKFDLFWAYLWMSLLYPILLLAGFYLFGEALTIKTVLSMIFIVGGVIVINWKANG